MRKILTIMWKDVSVLMRDWAALILIIAGPLVLTVGLGLVTGSFGGNDDGPAIGNIPVLVVDQDGGQFADALLDTLTGPELSDLLAAEQWADEAAALERVQQGEATAAIIIPAGFSDSFLPDTATGDRPAAVPLQVYGDPGAPIGAGVVRTVAESFTTQAQNGVSTVQIALTGLAAGGLPPAELPAVGQALGEQHFAGEGQSAAPLIDLRRQSAAGDDDSGFNALAFFAPAMALLFLMYAVTLGARTLLSERREGTLARMLAAPVTPAQVLSGKVAGVFLGGFLQLAALIVLTTTLFQLNWGNPLGVLLLVVAAALAATGWGVLLAASSANAAQVTTLGMALTLIFGILGGSFFPVGSVGPLLDLAGRITPNYWALDGFTALAAGRGLAGVAVPVAVLLLMAAVLFVVAAVVFRRRQGALLIG